MFYAIFLQYWIQKSEQMALYIFLTQKMEKMQQQQKIESQSKTLSIQTFYTKNHTFLHYK